MPIFSKWTFVKNELTWTHPNYWDAIALCFVLGILILLGLGAQGMSSPYQLGEPIPISLDPAYLPYYGLRSVLRMGLALACSLLFTLIVGTAAAKSTHAERFLIPLIDILQSVPVLGYLSITVVVFIALFPNSLLGPECAAIFAIFTAQVWNMTLSFYQSLKTVPEDLEEAAQMFQLSPWQRFWKLDAAFAMPGLLWNAMMSMSASWFFVVASEAISVNHQNITLPGIGSYIALAVQHADIQAVCFAILAMFVVILLYDQILFRPLNEWIEKFKFEQVKEEVDTYSWVAQMFRRTKWLRHGKHFFYIVWDYFVNLPSMIQKPTSQIVSYKKNNHSYWIVTWYIFLCIGFLVTLILLIQFVFSAVMLKEAGHVIYFGLITALRVIALIILSSIVWIPLGVWIGLRPRVAKTAQPLIQFLASFPVNLLYPIAVLLIVQYDLNINIWSSVMMMLGAQWYIAFNVIAGTIALPKDLRQAAGSLNVRGWLWWRKLILPGIFPYFVTGAITASGGAWNASIIAEIMSWGKTQLVATGLGAYITQQANAGDFQRLVLGIAVMCMYVLIINSILWRPLYRFVQERFKLS
jgi:NitT/TauT family transport system permease protein